MGRSAFLNRPIGCIHLVFIFVGIGIGLWAYIANPGVYAGHLQGSFTLMAADATGPRLVTVEARNAPRWAWSSASTFPYPLVRVAVDDEKGEKSMEVLFPDPKTNADGQEEVLTVEKFTAFVVGREQGLDEQARELFAFVKAIGQGAVLGPRHHSYHVEKPRGWFTHFADGTPAFVFLIGMVAASWAVTAVGVRLAKRRRKPTITK